MKTPQRCIVVLCILFTALSACAKNDVRKQTFDFAGHRRLVYLVVPEKSEPMPVIVLLHGSGRNGGVMIDCWKQLALREGFIIAAPDAFTPAAWSSVTEPPEFFRGVVDQVKAVHSIDEGRIYLFGHSAGAAYGLFLAVMDSDLFAATAVHAGALQANPEGLFEEAVRKMPIAIWVGDQDPNFPVETVEATRKLFAANGFPIKLTVIPHHDHNYYVISDEVNAKAWSFLKGTRIEPAATDATPNAAPASQS